MNRNQKTTINESSDITLRALRAGFACVVSEDWLDSASAFEWSNDLHSAFNRGQIGTKDRFVAWMGSENQPADLEIVDTVCGMLASATGFSLSELRSRC